MMREILFRGMTLSGEWVYGSYAPRKNDGLKRHYIFDSTWDDTQNADFSGCSFHNAPTLKDLFDEVRPETIGQFTGLTDKNGTKVFEGDVLKYNDLMISIRWDITGANWQFDEHTTFDDGVGLGNWDFKMGIAKNSEVIGNIHQHAELMKGE
jgi:uncharacterized phage protein (TIGR01671 family)